MSIAGALSADTSPARKGPPCEVCALLTKSTPEDATALIDALSDPEQRYTEISERLATVGVYLPDGTLSRHARGRCLARKKLR